jgi:hypothetical protein
VSPETVQKLQTALHAKAKEEPSYRCSMTARGSCNARLGLEDRFGIDRSLPASTTEALDIAGQSAAVQKLTALCTRAARTQTKAAWATVSPCHRCFPRFRFRREHAPMPKNRPASARRSSSGGGPSFLRCR